MGQELSTYRPSKDPRLTRFFSKLLDEVLNSEADSVAFTFGPGESSTGTIEKNRNVLKTIKLKSDWFQPLSEWLGFRNAQYLTGRANSSLHYTGENFLSFEYSSECFLDKRTRLTLSKFQSYEPATGLDLLGVPPENQEAWRALFKSNVGIVLLSSSSQENLDAARSLFLSVSGWSKFASLTDVKEFSEYANSEPVLITTIGKEILDPLFALKDPKVNFDKNLLSLVLQHGFVRKVCKGCARKAAPYPDLLKSLPDYLSELKKDHYMVGRGCNACDESGYSGVTGIQNALFLDHENDIADLLGKTELELIETLWKHGAKPLLEMGIRKAFAGQTTLESVFSVSKFIPQGYIEYEKRHGKEKEAQVAAQPLFSPIIKPVREKPVVLVLEDDPDQLHILELALKDNNYDVRSAANGQEGLNLLEKIEVPDIIISDLMMPVMDGSNFVKNLKSNSKFSTVPVLMFTMINDEEKEFELLNLGADDYCEKTVSRKVLMKRVENLVKRGVA